MRKENAVRFVGVKHVAGGDIEIFHVDKGRETYEVEIWQGSFPYSRHWHADRAVRLSNGRELESETEIRGAVMRAVYDCMSQGIV